MQRKEKKARSRKGLFPLMPLLPLLLAASLFQGIIVIFSEIHLPILLIDILISIFYCSILVLEIWGAYRDQPFKDKNDVLKLVGWYLTARPLITVNVENGKILCDGPLADQRKLLTIDPASAAAIRTPSDPQIQILPAGMVCLEKGQTILSTFDLRTQTSVSPTIPREDEISLNDPLLTGSLRFASRSSFSVATTADGYQLGARFLVRYKYDIEFGEGENPYGFDAAILRKVHQADSIERGSFLDSQHISQERIQATLQSIWQSSISQFALLDVIPQEQNQPSKLEEIELEIRRQVENAPLSSLEKEAPAERLRSYGLRVLTLSILSIWLPEETEIAIQHHWQPQIQQLLNGLQNMQQHKTALFQELGEVYALYESLANRGSGH